MSNISSSLQPEEMKKKHSISSDWRIQFLIMLAVVFERGNA